MTVPLILITLGVLLLMNNIDPVRFQFGRMWPVILIVIGLVKIFEYFGRQDVLGRRPGGRRHGPKARRASGPVRSEDAVEGSDNRAEEP